MRSVIFSIILLSFNCLAGNKFNPDYYLAHPEALQKFIKKCQTEEQDEKTKEYCDAAFTVAQKITHLFEELIHNPQTWGMKIMDKQYRLVELQEKGASKEQLHTLEQEIIVLQAVARLASGR